MICVAPKSRRNQDARDQQHVIAPSGEYQYSAVTLRNSMNSLSSFLSRVTFTFDIWS